MSSRSSRQGALRLAIAKERPFALHNSTQRRFLRFEEPFTAPPPHDPTQTPTRRQCEMMGASLRAESEAAIEAVMRARAAELPAALERVRAIQRIVARALSLGLCAEHDAIRSERQAMHPLTLTDYLVALEGTVQSHRPPTWYRPERSALDEIRDRLDLLAAMVCEKQGAAQAWESYEGGVL